MRQSLQFEVGVAMECIPEYVVRSARYAKFDVVETCQVEYEIDNLFFSFVITLKFLHSPRVRNNYGSTVFN